MAKPIPRDIKVSVAPVVAFGDRGHSKLAAAAGISRQVMSFIVNGDKPVTDDVYQRVAGALSKEADRLKAVAVKLDKMALQMLREMEE
jgi:plasmid maintenance system antidote protein VapI